MKQNHSDLVFNYIKKNIYTNKWKQGDQITPEIQLSKELNVGRNSVREAIQKFVGLNILKRTKGKGTFVCFSGKPTDIEEYINNSFNDNQAFLSNKKNLLETLEFRLSFDVENVKKFLKNADIQDFQELEKCYQLMLEHQNNSEKFTFYDAKFHMTLANGTKNSVIIKIAKFLSDLMLMHQKTINKLLGPSGGIDEHKLILDCIKNKDWDLSIYYTKLHIQRIINEVEEKFIEN